MKQIESTNPGPRDFRPRGDIAAAAEALPRPVFLPPAPDALGLFKALRRRWAMSLVLGAAPAAAVGATTWYVVPRAKYTASASLHIATKQKRIMFDPRDNQADFRVFQRTQVALIKSPKVVSKVLAVPEVARLATIKEQLEPEEWLIEQLKADFPGGGEVLNISLSGDRPNDLAAVVNEVLNSYMVSVVDEERQEKVARLEKLKSLKLTYQKDLLTKRNLIKELAQDVGSTDQTGLALNQQFRAEQLAVSKAERVRVVSELMRAEADLKALGAAPGGEPAAPDEVEVEVIDGRLKRHPELLRLEAQVNSLAQRYQDVKRGVRSASDPSVVAIRTRWGSAYREWTAARQRLRDEMAEQAGRPPQMAALPANHPAQLKGRVSALRAYRDSLEDEIKKLQEDTKAVIAGGVDLEVNRDDLALTSDISNKVNAEIEAMQVELQAPERVTVIARANVPRKKDELRQVKAGTGAAAVTFLCVLLSVSFWEFQARRIDSPEEVVQGLGIRLVGALPAKPSRPLRRRGGSAAAGGAEVDPRWQSLLVESIDATRTMLLHASEARSIQVVMITSAVKGEGKTSLATLLATSIARSGRKALLIDGDLRSPAAHRLFGMALQPGLSEYLRGQAALAEVIHRTAATGLHMIPAGKSDPVAIQGLARDNLRGLFDQLKGLYDLVIVDSAPVLPVADSLLIGQGADAVILSVLREVSRLPLVNAAYERLASLRVNLLGVVVTGVGPGAYGSYPYTYGEPA